MYAERNSRLLFGGPASDRIHRLSRLCRTECDLTSASDTDDQSLRGQAPKSRLPTGLPSRCHGVLEAPHTRRVSPLLAGHRAESLPHRAIRLPDKEFRSALLLVDLSARDRRVAKPPPYVAIGLGPYLHLKEVA